MSDVVIDDVNDHEFGGNKYTKSGDNFLHILMVDLRKERSVPLN